MNFIIEYKEAAVGMVALLEIDKRNKKALIGRFLIGERKKVGRAPVFFETELLLCDYAFDGLGINKLYGDIMEDNVMMIRARLHLGYHQDGILRAHYVFNGVTRNSVAVSLLKDEYRKMYRPKLLKYINALSH